MKQERRILSDFFWVSLDRISRLAVAIVMTSWMARRLGPDDFGLLSYVVSFAGIVAAIAPLAIDGVAVVQITKYQKPLNLVVGTAIYLRLLSGTACIVFGMFASLILGNIAPNATFLIGVTLSGLIGQAFEACELHFRASNRMAMLVPYRLANILAVNLAKALLLTLKPDLTWFAALSAIEMVLAGSQTYFLYKKSVGSSSKLAFSRQIAGDLLLTSWPLLASSLVIIAYAKTAPVIVGQMLGAKGAGVIAAAIRVPDALTFLPATLVAAYLPKLARHNEHESPESINDQRDMIMIATTLGLALSGGLTLFSDLIVRILFGTGYGEAATAMKVYSWMLLFLATGSARGQILVAQSRTRLSLFFSIFGAISYFTTMALLTPRFGITGAAAASTVAQFISSLLATWIPRGTRDIAKLQIEALVFPWRTFGHAYSKFLQRR